MLIEAQFCPNVVLKLLEMIMTTSCKQPPGLDILGVQLYVDTGKPLRNNPLGDRERDCCREMVVMGKGL